MKNLQVAILDSPGANSRRRMAFYGGSFDPPHNGHLAIAEKLTSLFNLDEFVFIPAFHAPHKPDLKPTSAYHRYAMLALATGDMPRVSVSRIEIEQPEKPYTVETLGKLKDKYTDADIFFVMGADSWTDILTWREWEKVLTMTNHIVVTRPGYEISFDHVTDEIRGRIADVRGEQPVTLNFEPGTKIYITDAVVMNISATQLRRKIRAGEHDWEDDAPVEVAKYIEKYQIYK